MTSYDVFNGDADGLCALVQLRLAEPRDSVLVTGVKREIALLGRVPAVAGDQVTALDLSLDRNREDLRRLLDAGAWVRYFDHHYAGEIPVHQALEFHHEPRPDRGTSLLVDAALGGAWRAWAVVGTFGDNFEASARAAAATLDLAEAELELLRALGICLNYNAYGASVADLRLPPDDLFRRLRPYADPLDFIAADPSFALLRDGHAEDMARARALQPAEETPGHRILILPAEPWARRASGVLANALARAAPDCAHALLTTLPEGGFLVSVRAPLQCPQGADELCRAFPTGGGRPAAAGIDRLPENRYDRFAAAFRAAFR